jgi:hypothetical protein
MCCKALASTAGHDQPTASCFLADEMGSRFKDRGPLVRHWVSGLRSRAFAFEPTDNQYPSFGVKGLPTVEADFHCVAHQMTFANRLTGCVRNDC